MKKQILITISLVLIGMSVVLIFLSFQIQKGQLQAYIDRKLTLLGSYYDSLAKHEAYEMESTLKAIMLSSEIKEALKKGDRELLLKLSDSLYKQLRGRGVTHFYFTGPDRRNLLRVHKPDRFGDIINRKTTIQAEITGKETSGMELGPLGTFTLRVVAPWFDGDELIGYVELGKEVEHAVEEMRELLGVRAYAFIHKEYLVQSEWEEGLGMLGRKAEWGRFGASVNVSQNISDMPPMLLKFLADEQLAKNRESINVRVDDRTYRTGYLPLLDVNKEEVGHISVMVDMNNVVTTFSRYIMMVIAICLFAIAITIIATFFIFSINEEESEGLS